MKKVLICTLALCLIITMLCACGSSGQNGNGANGGNGGGAYVPNPDEFDLIDVAHFDREWNLNASSLGYYKLDLTLHDPATSSRTKFLEEWSRLIYEATNGGVEISVFPGGTLASATESFQTTELGVTDIAWFIASNYAKVLPCTGMFYLPGLGLGRNVLDADVMWNMYDKYPQMEQDYTNNNLKLLMLYSTGGVIISGKKIETLDDLKGRNIRSTGGYAADILATLGASPISMGPGDLYDSMSKGVIDDYCLEWSGIKTFRTYEVTDYYNNDAAWVTVMALVINLDSFNRLPAEYKEVIEYYSGREMSLQQAYLWGEEINEYHDSYAEPGQNINYTPEDKAKLLEICKEYSTQKAKELNRADFDAEAFLEDIYAEVEAHKDYVYYREQ